MDTLDKQLSKFLEQQQLPISYAATAKDWFLSLARDIYTHHSGANKPIIIGINGAQGSGKSTLAALIVFLMENHFGLRAVTLSLDDFYYTRAERKALAEKVHPLLMTRGVPGTHDVALATNTLNQLLNAEPNVSIPRFNKAVDDRHDVEQFETLSEPADIIVFEGWCMGSTAQAASELAIAVNDLEETEDADASWRSYVNQQLQDVYPALFNMMDIWVMLKAPSFECVFNWRMEQEQKLKQSLSPADAQQKVMDETAIHRFIKFYQRITENTLKTLPAKVDYLYEMDEQRNIINLVSKPLTQQTDTTEPQWLVFTDMDGSLLDHHSYRYDEAIPVMEWLESHHIPLMPISSKTFAELELFRDSINNYHPFIVENGAAVFIPIDYFEQQPEGTVIQGEYWVKEFVQPRQHWQSLIEELRPEFGSEFKTFAEVGIDGIMKLTGLNVHSAARSARRGYGEPVSWHGNGQLQQNFIEAIEAKGAQVLKGGRFIHVSGNCDKGKALQWLKQVYQQYSPNKQILTLAIGDSHNDKAMLETADYALLIRSPVRPLPDIEKSEHVYISKDTGPKGWAQGVSDIVDATLHPDSLDIPRGNHG